jgi:type 1 glutamine amidotransferase
MAEPLTVLVIGENEYPFHRLEEKAPLFEALFADTDVDVTVTTNRNALARDRLAAYDVLIDYTTEPPTTHSESVVDFVRDGGGFVGIHGASDVSSMADEPADDIAALIGARFVDHPENTTFNVSVIDADHPITAGVSDFAVYDEPYNLALDEPDDRHVLARMEHPDLAGTPVAWTRSEGEGRVFYCSLGHTDEAFEHDAVGRLFVQGTRWAAGATP